MILLSWLIACRAEPFEGDVTVDSTLSAPPPARRVRVTLTVRNPADEPRWVLFPRKPEQEFQDISIAAIERTDDLGSIEFRLEERSGRSWRAFPLEAGEVVSHRTELFSVAPNPTALDVWLVSDVRLPGCGGLTEAPERLDPGDANPATRWTCEDQGIAVLEEPLHRKLTLTVPAP